MAYPLIAVWQTRMWIDCGEGVNENTAYLASLFRIHRECCYNLLLPQVT